MLRGIMQGLLLQLAELSTREFNTLHGLANSLGAEDSTTQ